MRKVRNSALALMTATAIAFTGTSVAVAADDDKGSSISTKSVKELSAPTGSENSYLVKGAVFLAVIGVLLAAANQGTIAHKVNPDVVFRNFRWGGLFW